MKNLIAWPRLDPASGRNTQGQAFEPIAPRADKSDAGFTAAIHRAAAAAINRR